MMLGGARHIKDAELAISAGDGDPTTVMRHVYAVTPRGSFMDASVPKPSRSNRRSSLEELPPATMVRRPGDDMYQLPCEG